MSRNMIEQTGGIAFSTNTRQDTTRVVDGPRNTTAGNLALLFPMNRNVNLNESGLKRCETLVADAARLNVAVHHHEDCGVRVVDCGVSVGGGIEAGRAMAEICMAGLGQVAVAPGNDAIWQGPAIMVSTDQPVAACMASQYAGWPVSSEKYFAMGSGPMRAARGREPIFDDIGFVESVTHAVGVLESGQLPPSEACQQIAEECNVEPSKLTLLVAPTASLAGTIQVVSRSVETALHKMHELKFDLSRVLSGFGVAPLPPVAANDMAGIGRTNDAVLYGGDVTLWVTGDDESLRELGPQIPSSASSDHGRPFAQIFESYDRDFYKIDPLLFSPARISLVNVDTGSSFRFGEILADVIRESFTS